MKIFKLPMIFICISVINIATVTANTQPVKIAIISAPGKYKAEIDLLTEKLSAKKDLHVLDRVDIDYLLKEHAIAASDISKNSIKIGQLIGADGVIVLSDVEVKGKKYAYLRLVGVKNGIILGTYAYPLDVKSESLDWLVGIHKQFDPLFSKLNLSKKEALPVSLLNFRSSSPSQTIIKLETIIPKLLTIGLNKAPKIVVTERWNAWQVAFEKELANDLSNFHTGNVLIDGSIEEKGDDIEIMARINKPGTDKKHAVKVTGSKKELPKLMRELSASLSKYLNKNSTAVDWDTAAEAKKFYEEAKWAYEFSKYQQAEEASDAAMALGLDSFELAILRARILGGQYFLISDLNYRSNHYTTPLQFNSIPIKSPENHLFNACKALDILAETRRRLLTPKYHDEWKTKENKDKFDRLERNFLVFCPRLLIQSHIANLHRNKEFADILKMLQLKVRTLFNAIVSRPSWQIGGSGTNSNPENHKHQAYMMFFATGICWYNNFNEWLTGFDKLLRNNSEGKDFYLVRRGITEGRNRLFYAKDSWPFKLKCFKKEFYNTPVENLFTKWDAYIAKLQNSNDPRENLDGALLFDFKLKEYGERKALLKYVAKNIQSKKGSQKYKYCKMAAKILGGSDDFYRFPPSPVPHDEIAFFA